MDILNEIKQRFTNHEGDIFLIKDFIDLAPELSSTNEVEIHEILSRLVKEEFIHVIIPQSLTKRTESSVAEPETTSSATASTAASLTATTPATLYIKLSYSRLLKKHVYPSPNLVAHKIAENFNWNITVSKNKALNLTGLDTQVPNTYLFASSGPTATFQYRNVKIYYEHVNEKWLFNKSSEFSILLQAINALTENELCSFTKKNLLVLAEFKDKYIKDDILDETIVHEFPEYIKNILIQINNVKLKTKVM